MSDEELCAQNARIGHAVTADAAPEDERHHLERCVELAEEALAAEDEPFGSVLVSADGRRLAEGRNRVVETGDRTQHPEVALARWAARHLSPRERAAATVFTSGSTARCARRRTAGSGSAGSCTRIPRSSSRSGSWSWRWLRLRCERSRLAT